MPDEALWKLIRRNSFIILQPLVHQALRQGFFCSTRGQNVRDKQDVRDFCDSPDRGFRGNTAVGGVCIEG